MRLRIALLLLALPLFACPSSATVEKTPQTGGIPSDAGVTALAIDPANTTITVTDGASIPVEFKATGVSSTGQQTRIEAAWRIEPDGFGNIDPATGRFVATGQRAGEATVTATAHGLQAHTKVKVQVGSSLVLPGTPSDAATKFTTTPTPNSAEAPVILYPLVNALVPSSLRSMAVHWEGGVEGDLYRVTLQSGAAAVSAYVRHSGAAFTYGWVVDDASWSLVKRSVDENGISFGVDRVSTATGQLYSSARTMIRMVAAEVSGAIYYWDLNEGKMMRITAKGREELLPSAPASPTGGKCVACHAVSRDGRYLAAQLWEVSGPTAIFDLSKEPVAGPLFPTDKHKASFAAFNHDASRLLLSELETLKLIEPTTGTVITPGGDGLPSTGVSHVAWSPDGKTIAYAGNINERGGINFTTSDLTAIPVTAPDIFGPPKVLRAAEGQAVSWPTFSPDSSWVAYGRGPHSRSAILDSTGARVLVPGALYLISREGGPEVRLDNANGGPLAADSYLPSFSPFDEGGYYWLAFYSTRPYGNAQMGTRATKRRQLWVTAIKRNPLPGEDPSSVPFWLPDQSVGTDNMSAFWTLPAPIN